MLHFHFYLLLLLDQHQEECSYIELKISQSEAPAAGGGAQWGGLSSAAAA